MAYGPATAAMWLVPELFNLAEFSGVKTKWSDAALEECANLIVEEYHEMKISEMMLFFHRFKLCRYGRFYGAVDPLVIMSGLREFAGERAEAYKRHEEQEYALRMEEQRKNAISYEDYCKLKKKGEGQ